MQSRDPDETKKWAEWYEAYFRTTKSLDVSREQKIEIISEILSRMRNQKAEISINYLLAITSNKKENDGNEIKAPVISWPYWLMPHDRIDDALAGLEEAYVNRLLPIVCGGNERKARRIFYWQVCLIIAGYHANRIKACCAGALVFFGLGKFMDLWRS